MSQIIPLTHQGFDIPLEVHNNEQNQTRRPGLLLLHDQWGLDDFTRAAAARLADAGYVIALPDLFARSSGPAEDSDVARQDFLHNLSDAQVTGDALAALHFLVNHENVDKKRLGVLGWGWGGAFALLCAGHDSRLSAVANIGGLITYPMHSTNHSGSPLNFIADIEGTIFCAYPQNEGPPSGEIARLRERLVEHDKLGEVKAFTGTAGRFWRQDTPQAALLWRRIEQFFAETFELDADTLLFADSGQANEESRLHAADA
jgi:carboxymethylenebutenolidase